MIDHLGQRIVPENIHTSPVDKSDFMKASPPTPLEILLKVLYFYNFFGLTESPPITSEEILIPTVGEYEYFLKVQNLITSDDRYQILNQFPTRVESVH